MNAAALVTARTIADAVLYEGYLLYPYRASSSKNAVRWQFGVLGPPGAASEVGEPAAMHAELLLRGPADAELTVHLRFLQLQARTVEKATADGFVPVPDLHVDGGRWLAWDEAVPHELSYGPFPLDATAAVEVRVPGGDDVEPITDHTATAVGRLVRRRRALAAQLELTADDLGAGLFRIGLTVTNAGGTHGKVPATRDEATAVSFLGAHLLVETDQATFVSLLEPPPDARAAAQDCRNTRCWPVLAAPTGDLVLVSPIILYDHPEVAPESAGDLFDATEIDEILTLRVMTMTDAEKAEARATDPRAAAIVDRCDAMSPDVLNLLHGRLRDPRAGLLEDTGSASLGSPTFGDAPIGDAPFGSDFDIPVWSDADVRRESAVDTDGKPWWDPGVDASVDPDRDEVSVRGVLVSRGSRVRVQPSRRADAQDLFFAGREATVAAVYADVDGNDHVAVVLTDDPGADVRDWYGRYLYFAPDELEPIGTNERDRARKEG